MEIKSIIEDIKPEWEKVQNLLNESLASNCELLNRINTYLLGNMGKQLRPMLGLLAAKTCGISNERTITVSTVAELIHCATLLHDDVADNSNMRRGQKTVHKLFSPAASVLTGDYWLARALFLISKIGDSKLLEYFVTAVESLSEGELIQMDKAMNPDASEEDYYTVIRGKTASLFKAVILSASYTAGADEKARHNMEEFADHLGIAFQIRDDIFDYAPQYETGKEPGTDIREKKITLPLIKALEISPGPEASSLLNKIKEAPEVTGVIVKEVFDFVEKYKGIYQAQMILKNHCDKARSALDDFPDSVYKFHLQQLAEYIGEREK
jgi:octaprenyl-diphosphate synthase